MSKQAAGTGLRLVAIEVAELRPALDVKAITRPDPHSALGACAIKRSPGGAAAVGRLPSSVALVADRIESVGRNYSHAVAERA